MEIKATLGAGNKALQARLGGKNTGLSAYEVAVKNGYEGSETDWLESLKGEDGKDYILTEEDKLEIAGKVDIPGVTDAVTEDWVKDYAQPKGNYLEEIPEEYITEEKLAQLITPLTEAEMAEIFATE